MKMTYARREKTHSNVSLREKISETKGRDALNTSDKDETCSEKKRRKILRLYVRNVHEGCGLVALKTPSRSLLLGYLPGFYTSLGEKTRGSAFLQEKTSAKNKKAGYQISFGNRRIHRENN